MPGKFEGEPRYASLMYDMANEGMADDNFIDEYERQVDYFHITPGDDLYADIYAENGEHFLLWEDDQGFVYTKQFRDWEETRRYLIEALGADPWANNLEP